MCVFGVYAPKVDPRRGAPPRSCRVVPCWLHLLQRRATPASVSINKSRASRTRASSTRLRGWANIPAKRPDPSQNPAELAQRSSPTGRLPVHHGSAPALHAQWQESQTRVFSTTASIHADLSRSRHSPQRAECRPPIGVRISGCTDENTRV